MGDDDHAFSGGMSIGGQCFYNIVFGFMIQIPCWFIRDQYIGVVRQCTRYAHALLFAARQFEDFTVGRFTVDPDLFKNCRRTTRRKSSRR
jgi:hypothetical protein